MIVHRCTHQRCISQPVLRVCVRPGVEEELQAGEAPFAGGIGQGRKLILVRQLNVRAALQERLQGAGGTVVSCKAKHRAGSIVRLVRGRGS